MKLRSQSGVTLIEILVAVSLLSLLSVGMLTAMRLGFSTMDKVDAHLVVNRRVVNARGIIEGEINGFVLTMANYTPRPNEVHLIPFLQTEAQSMRFVTSYSLEDGWRGRPQIAVLQVIPGEAVTGDSRPGVRLIVNEMPYTGPAQAGQNIVAVEQDASAGRQIVRFAPVPPGPQSFVLADRLAFCRFWYLQPLREAPFQIWRPDWVRPQSLPLGIRIEMAPLDDSPNGLHVTTVTTLLSVNLTPGWSYVDQ
jgi:prepilin-type N-terminal cleavage/methylation domain-containing protein